VKQPRKRNEVRTSGAWGMRSALARLEVML